VIRAVLAVAVAVGALWALLFAPTTFGADLRRTLAVKAVQGGMPALGVALLAPLADGGDAAAQNNLAVLLQRGIGAPHDAVKAAQLFNTAANSGLARAQMNLALLRTPCTTHDNLQIQMIAKLEAFARAGDRRAASFVADCISSASDFEAASRRLIEAATLATKSNDPDEELKFGRLLMDRMRRARGWGTDHTRRETFRLAAGYLLRAADHGKPAAYEGLSLLRRELLDLLEPSPERDKVAAKDPAEWLDIAARSGHPKSQCTMGARLAAEVSHRFASMREAERQRIQEHFAACLKGRNPRQVVLLGGGKERMVGYDPLLDVWMWEDPFLVISPRYENYDYDTVARDDALAQMSRVMDRR
jgi:TPR repeat protein